MRACDRCAWSRDVKACRSARAVDAFVTVVRVSRRRHRSSAPRSRNAAFTSAPRGRAASLALCSSLGALAYLCVRALATPCSAPPRASALRSHGRASCCFLVSLPPPAGGRVAFFHASSAAAIACRTPQSPRYPPRRLFYLAVFAPPSFSLVPGSGREHPTLLSELRLLAPEHTVARPPLPPPSPCPLGCPPRCPSYRCRFLSVSFFFVHPFLRPDGPLPPPSFCRFCTHPALSSTHVPPRISHPGAQPSRSFRSLALFRSSHGADSSSSSAHRGSPLSLSPRPFHDRRVPAHGHGPVPPLCLSFVLFLLPFFFSTPVPHIPFFVRRIPTQARRAASSPRALSLCRDRFGRDLLRSLPWYRALSPGSSFVARCHPHRCRSSIISTPSHRKERRRGEGAASVALEPGKSRAT